MPLPLHLLPHFLTLNPGSTVLFYCLKVKLEPKAKLSDALPPSVSPSLGVPYLVLIGRIKGYLCHLGTFLSHLLHRAVRLLDELEEGRL